MLVDLSKTEIQILLSSLMSEDKSHSELYNKLLNLSQVCTCKENKV